MSEILKEKINKKIMFDQNVKRDAVPFSIILLSTLTLPADLGVMAFFPTFLGLWVKGRLFLFAANAPRTDLGVFSWVNLMWSARAVAFLVPTLSLPGAACPGFSAMNDVWSNL